MRYTFGLAAVLGGAYAVDTSAALLELFQAPGNFAEFDFWKYFFLAFQDDTSDAASNCISAFEDYQTLYEHVVTITSDTADYIAGIAAKGNGYADINGATNMAGFAMYSVMNYIDVGIEFVEIYDNCQFKNIFLGVAKPITSVSGLLNTGVNIIWRTVAADDDDTANYLQLSNAITASDYSSAGNAFGYFIKSLLMTDIPALDYDEGYQYVEYLAA